MKQVPKCKKCNYHAMYPPSHGLMSCHWCGHPKVLLDGHMDNPMYASEFKTSPKWRPLRINEIEYYRSDNYVKMLFKEMVSCKSIFFC